MSNPVLYLAIVIAGSLLIRALKLLTWPATFVTAGIALLLLFAGGWSWLTPALVFFVSGSIWTRWPGASRQRDRTRRAAQVIANGGPAMLFAAFALFNHSSALAAAVAGSFAAAAADTWATEWGGRFGGSPVSLRTFSRVPAGHSGAISLLGTIATAMGALTVAAACASFRMISWNLVPIIALAGGLASLVDSLTGAWLQGLWKDADGAILEQRLTDRSIRHVRGVPWINNDAVNLIATLSGGLLALWWAT